ncbi:MAG: hypothetical protein JXQ84_05690, partial [Rhodospirillaceae bacterium]|nr:hypothetical protein [Rhodospirillaceae bacterium]
DVLAATMASEVVVEGVLDKLRRSGFADHTEDGDWVLLRDLAEVPMATLVASLGWGWSAEAADRLPEVWRPALLNAFAESQHAEQEAWSMAVRTVVEARKAS